MYINNKFIWSNFKSTLPHCVLQVRVASGFLRLCMVQFLWWVEGNWSSGCSWRCFFSHPKSFFSSNVQLRVPELKPESLPSILWVVTWVQVRMVVEPTAEDFKRWCFGHPPLLSDGSSITRLVWFNPSMQFGKKKYRLNKKMISWCLSLFKFIIIIIYLKKRATRRDALHKSEQQRSPVFLLPRFADTLRTRARASGALIYPLENSWLL